MCLTSKSKFCPIRNHVQKNEINSAVSRTQNVGIDHNDVLLSVSFLSRINFRVAVGITEASGTPVVYKAFSRLVWRANIFGIVKEREECCTCLSRNESSHGKQLTLHRVFFLQCSVTLTLDNVVENNIILSKINSRTGNENRERKIQTWKPERGKIQVRLFERLREAQDFPIFEQTLEDKQVVQLRLHVRLLLHTSEK